MPSGVKMVEVGLHNPRAFATYIYPSVSLTREASQPVDQQKPLHLMRKFMNSVYDRGRMASWEGILLLCRVMKQSTNRKRPCESSAFGPRGLLLSREASGHITKQFGTDQFTRSRDSRTSNSGDNSGLVRLLTLALTEHPKLPGLSLCASVRACELITGGDEMRHRGPGSTILSGVIRAW
jgi:hypothetical protein